MRDCTRCSQEQLVTLRRERVIASRLAMPEWSNDHRARQAGMNSRSSSRAKARASFARGKESCNEMRFFLMTNPHTKCCICICGTHFMMQCLIWLFIMCNRRTNRMILYSPCDKSYDKKIIKQYYKHICFASKKCNEQVARTCERDNPCRAWLELAMQSCDEMRWIHMMKRS